MGRVQNPEQFITANYAKRNGEMKNKIYLLVFIFLLLPFVAAQIAELPPAKQNTCIQLLQSYSNSSYHNVSNVLLPDKTILILNQTMQSTGNGMFNRTFCNTSLLGDYIVNGYGDKDGIKTSWAYSFVVTPTGLRQTTSQSIGSLSFLALMFGLTILFGWLGFKYSESEYLWVLGLFFMVLGLFFIVYDTWLAAQYYITYTGESDNSMPQTIFYILMFILIAGFIVSGVLLFKYWKKVKDWFYRAKSDEESDMAEDTREWR